MRCHSSLMALVASILAVVEGAVIHSRALPGVKVTFQEVDRCPPFFFGGGKCPL